ncbi:MAG: UDP-N-acetylmuramoyl-tripeptide--D-alanyl-D-alanine ligase [Cryobacterium sp.]|nr:UDP-N-acetylmuramoyl-tripeptide--D-alanyl-D-alanine ligase [Cryobacterium sp.]
MIALTLAQLAEAVRGTLHLPAGARDDARAELTVGGEVRVDSRLVAPGDVFFCQRGEATDGHEFARSAVDAGAVALVVERELDIPVAQVVVADAHDALTELARFVVARVRELDRLRVVGITGSNGKTTTKNMVRTILERVGQTVAPQGSFNNYVGAPLSMLGIDESTEFLVIELGAAARGEIAHLASIAVPDVATVLTVGLAHVGGFGSIETTRASKAELVAALRPGAVAVLNADDPRVSSMADGTVARVVTFGLGDGADVRARDVETGITGTTFTLEVGGAEHPVALRLIGEHQVVNALAALAIAHELGVALDTAIDALESMQRAEKYRMEPHETADGVTLINDAYNASPDSMAAALKTLALLTRDGRRSVAVLGEMAELGDHADEEHDRIGRLAVRLNIELLVVVGHAARHIHNAAGLEGSWDGESMLVDTVDEAYDLLRGEIRAGDVVLVKSSNSAGLRFLGDRLVEASEAR